MSDTPSSLIELQRRFPDDAACARYLVALRWPDGFRCPRCAHDHAWMLQTKARTYQCAGCGKQTSVTAGTVMHGSKLALTVWFWAAYLMAGHSNGVSANQLWNRALTGPGFAGFASQLWKLLGLGSYKTAWLLCAKLRRAMVDPERDPLVGVVEVDETTIAHRTAGDPVPPRPGRSPDGRLPIAAAVEVSGGVPGRIRLARITDYSAVSLRGFLSCNVAAGAIARTDGWSGYAGVPGHEPHVIGPMAAHVVLPWVHRVFANLKRWALGVYHGLRPKHLQSYLDEFVFRFNRRRNRPAAFQSLLRIGATTKPVTYKMLINPEETG